MREIVDDLLVRAESLARVYVDALAVAEGASEYTMNRSKDHTLDALLGLQHPVTSGAGSNRLRVDQILGAILSARCIAKEADLPGLLDRGQNVILVIETIQPEWVDLVEDVISRCAMPKGYKKTIIAKDGQDRSHAPDRGNALIHNALGVGGPIVGISTDPRRHLPSALMRTVEYYLVLPTVDAWAVRLLLEAVTGQAYVGEIDEAIIRSSDVGDFSIAFRPGNTHQACLHRLYDLVSAKASFSHNGPKLEHLHGYGEAGTWGLELIADMKDYVAGRLDWSDIVNRTVLLSSAPGLGKTSFAQALARSMNAHLVATSVADWNAASHLAGTLQAMRSAFAEARHHRPSVLLVDEFEGIGARNRLSGDYVEYWTQIINLLLELLSNASDLEGVIVVAATNHPEKIDSALLRSGRIDKHIAIQRPSCEDLARIFQYYLDADFPPETSLMPLALAATGATGADVAKWVSRAKARARRGGLALSLDHLLEEIRGGAPQLSPVVRHRVAVHEAGHAILAHHFELGSVKSMAIVPGGGSTEINLNGDVDLVERELDRTMAFFLAGRAAEQLLTGACGSGSGGTDGNSDLERATSLAVQAECTFGFGEALGLVNMRMEHSNMLVMVPALLSSVRIRLDNAMALAVEVLTTKRAELEAVAKLLEEKGYLTWQDIAPLLAGSRDEDLAA